jgi:hypothetical protein
MAGLAAMSYDRYYGGEINVRIMNIRTCSTPPPMHRGCDSRQRTEIEWQHQGSARQAELPR